eukprot:g73425.t1
MLSRRCTVPIYRARFTAPGNLSPDLPRPVLNVHISTQFHISKTQQNIDIFPRVTLTFRLTAASLLPHHCLTVASLLPHHYRTIAAVSNTQQNIDIFPRFTLTLRPTAASPLPHHCLTIKYFHVSHLRFVSPLPHHCLTIASPLPHHCLTIASLLPHYCLTPRPSYSSTSMLRAPGMDATQPPACQDG